MENTFSIYAVVELMGHNRIAGQVTEQSIGGATFIKVSVPETKEQPAFDRFLNPSAIYAINPVTKEVADAMASRIQSKPIQVWDVQEVVNKMKALTKGAEEDEAAVDEEEEQYLPEEEEQP